MNNKDFAERMLVDLRNNNDKLFGLRCAAAKSITGPIKLAMKEESCSSMNRLELGKIMSAVENNLIN